MLSVFLATIGFWNSLVFYNAYLPEIADPSDTLRAAWVSYNSRLRMGLAREDVQLSDDEAILDSDSLIYYRGEKRAVFESPVRLIEREGGGVMTSRRGEYFTERKEAFFRDDVRLVDSTSVLTSDFGRYGTEDKRADFSGNVFLTHDDDTRMRADSLSHYRDINETYAYGDVAILRFGGREDEEGVPPDTTQRSLIFGGFAFHDENAEYTRVERGLQTVDPVLVRLSTDSLGVTDSLLVQAHIFEAVQLDSLDGQPLPERSTLQRMYARGDVRMHGDRLAALADSGVVDRIEFEEELRRPVEDEIRLFQNPIAWMNSRGSTLYTQITGDTLVTRARDESIDSLFVFGSAFAIRPDSVLDRNNQIRGRSMLAVFREDELRGIRVWPNAESLFFRADSLGRLEGGMLVSGDSLSFVFRDEDLERISGIRSPEGVYYDAAILPTPFALDGPPYSPERRPTREDILAGRPPLEDPFSRPYIREIPEEESEEDVRTFFDLIREDDDEPPDDLPEDDDPHE